MNKSDSRLSLLWERYDNNWMNTFRISPKQMKMMSVIDRPIARVCKTCGQFHSPADSHLYDYHQAVDDDLTCEICLQPLVDPTDTKCGHTFCLKCITNFLKLQNVCPHDRNPLEPSQLQSAPIIIRRLLDKVEVVCPNVDYCETFLPRCELEDHLQHRCKGAVMKCARYKEGCIYQGPRGAMESHEWDCEFSLEKDEGLTTQIRAGEEGVRITLKRAGVNDLGLSIVGGVDTPLKGVFIQTILLNSLVDRDNRLEPGDQILEYAGHDMRNLTHLQAITIIKQEYSEYISMTILRKHFNCELEEEPSCSKEQDIIKITLMKQSNLTLGIKLSRRRKSKGVFIMDILPDSIAAHDGQLQIGDKILEINSDGISVTSQQNSASSISSSHGKISFIISRRRPDTPDLLRSITSAPIFNFTQSTGNFTEKSIILYKRRGESLGLSVAGGMRSKQGNTPLYVMDLVEQGPAMSCGVVNGDIVLSVNGADLTGLNHNDAVHLLKSKMNHKKVELRLLEWNDNHSEIEELFDSDSFPPPWCYWIQLPRSNWIESQVKVYPDGCGLGLRFSKITPEFPVCCIEAVQEDSSAALSNIRCGDILTKIDGVSLAQDISQSDLHKLLQKAGSKPKAVLTTVSWPGTYL